MSDAAHLTRDCPAKINLFLEVRSRRPDGFHEIDTVLQTVGLNDSLIARPVPEAGIHLTVFGADLPTDDGNLVHRAATRFFDEVAPAGGVAIRLDKRIPIQAGLGGGSSDAAGTLRILRDLFDPGRPLEDLVPWAADLGSDVPFFVRGGTARATGRGEFVTPLDPVPPRWLVLIRPDFGLSTPAVYGRVKVPEAPRDAEAYLAGGSPFNRLEDAAERLDPRVGEFRERIRGFLGDGESPVLSGSGSVFFVLVGDAHRAGALAAAWNREGDGGKALAVRTVP